MSTKLPIRIIRPLHRQCLFQRAPVRQFSISIALQAKKATRKPQISPSPQAEMDAAYRSDENIPDDLGLISGTFIRPPIWKLPIRNLKQWSQFEWNYVKSKVKGWYSLYVYRNICGTPKLDINILSDRRQLRVEAGIKYRNMYTFFADKNKKALSEICLSGVGTALNERLRSRPDNVKLHWKITKGDDVLPTIVSNRAQELNLPGYPQSAIRQLVFRVQRTHRLETKKSAAPPTPVAQVQDLPKKKKQRAIVWTPDGREPPEEVTNVAEGESTSTSRVEEQVTEYLVLQKRVLRGREDKHWRIWGFTSETTLDSIKRDERWQKQLVDYSVPN
ncbi:hypothetical protein K504DRAFT_463019 [Pleomassaria siparia CBS 279.74]|uniref:Uncharacterized protein n=1 Tax=Pleomassaria siparia CBS 279.74 TaxID=1314801 RepID=A0A6G1JUV5_9PLEO|nr:hypothetical protein K504DRAFT_463019 [Pleomassaria siparia CBS 279.74]